MRKKEHPPTLCWDCRNAVNGCSWARKGKPVNGWKAIPTKIKDPMSRKGYNESFVVQECPLFWRD